MTERLDYVDITVVIYILVYEYHLRFTLEQVAELTAVWDLHDCFLKNFRLEFKVSVGTVQRFKSDTYCMLLRIKKICRILDAGRWS